MKIAYLGIDLLKSVLDAALEQGCEVVRLFTCQTDNVTEFNTEVLEAARRLGIPATTRRVTRQDLDELAQAGCEAVLCAGYYYRVPVTNAFAMINVHPAPLPQCRGAWPMPLILLGAYPVGGVAFHKMDSGFDTGDILLERTFPIERGDTLQDYMRKVHALVPEMTRAVLGDLPGFLRRARRQGEGRYLPNPGSDVWTVRAQMDVEQADRVLRAFYGYECIYCRGEARFELIGARAVSGAPAEPFPLKDGYIIARKAEKI